MEIIREKEDQIRGLLEEGKTRLNIKPIIYHPRQLTTCLLKTVCTVNKTCYAKPAGD